MTIEEMHYDFKMKLNKLDSQQYRNLLIPEIDWLLNEAQENFLKLVLYPRGKSPLGLEKSQRLIDDARYLVRTKTYPIKDPKKAVDPSGKAYDTSDDILGVWMDEDEYLHLIKGEILVTKKACGNKIYRCRLRLRQHDDMTKDSPFDCTDIEWREVNGYFQWDYLALELPKEREKYNFTEAKITYLKKPVYMHFAQGFSQEGYKLPSGQILKGEQNCELPAQTHREIVDLAVLQASGQLQMSDYQIKLAKVKMNQS